MDCFVCGENTDVLDKVLLNADGDFACSDKCAQQYEKDKEQFFAAIKTADDFAAWWAKRDATEI